MQRRRRRPKAVERKRQRATTPKQHHSNHQPTRHLFGQIFWSGPPPRPPLLPSPQPITRSPPSPPLPPCPKGKPNPKSRGGDQFLTWRRSGGGKEEGVLPRREKKKKRDRYTSHFWCGEGGGPYENKYCFSADCFISARGGARHFSHLTDRLQFSIQV